MTPGRSPPPPLLARADATLELCVPAEAISSDALACLSADELLELLLGVLPEPKRDAAFQHIAGCEECRILFRSAAQAMEDTGPAPDAPAVGAFQPGMLVAGRYHVERFLACGGMGEVYCVLDQVLNERVALKTVRSRAIASPKAILRLKSETLLSRRIGHPNTCRIYEFGEHLLESGEKVCFLTMELVDGETLGERLRRDGPLPLEEVSILLRQLLGGMAEAHGLGIVHRDLKSDNIMLRTPTPGGLTVDAVIMDFGLALRIDSEQRLTSDSHALVGSAAYMAPEQVEGERLTPATDVYAFGIILFEMLTGQLPFRASTPASTALQRLHNPPPPPSSVRPGLDAHWDRLVLGCLERVVERRFASARDVLAAFERPWVVEPKPAPRRSHRRAVGVVVALAISLTGGVFLQRGNTGARSQPSQHLDLRSVTVSSSPSVEPAPVTPAAALLAKEPSPPSSVSVALPAGKASPPASAKTRTDPKSARRAVKGAAKVAAVEVAATAAAPSAASPTVAPPPPAPSAALPSPLDPLPLDPEFPE